MGRISVNSKVGWRNILEVASILRCNERLIKEYVDVTYCINSPVPLFKEMYRCDELFSRWHHEERNRSCKLGELYLRGWFRSGMRYLLLLLPYYSKLSISLPGSSQSTDWKAVGPINVHSQLNYSIQFPGVTEA